jgi:hypothetical protein
MLQLHVYKNLKIPVHNFRYIGVDLIIIIFFFRSQNLELLWNKERQLYTEQIQTLEQSLIETKKLSIDQQTQIMQLTVQFESTDGQLQAQVCFLFLKK